jgi:hypothetical protein
MNHVTIDGKELPVLFDMQALADFQLITGHNPFEIFGGKVKIAANEMIVLAYVGLKGANEDFEMTQREVGRKLKAKNFDEIIKALTEDLKDVIGAEDEKK